MADFNKFLPTLIKEEGGISNDKNDKGGLTKYGVTIADWKEHGWDKNGDNVVDEKDLVLITPEDAAKIAKIHYWDKIQGDKIDSQSVAELLFDWAYMSGPVTANKQVQQLMGLSADGISGSKTLKAINQSDPKTLFDRIKAKREAFFYNIVNHNPSQKVFLKGWLNRNRAFVFKS